MHQMNGNICPSSIFKHSLATRHGNAFCQVEYLPSVSIFSPQSTFILDCWFYMWTGNRCVMAYICCLRPHILHVFVCPCYLCQCFNQHQKAAWFWAFLMTSHFFLGVGNFLCIKLISVCFQFLGIYEIFQWHFVRIWAGFLLFVEAAIRLFGAFVCVIIHFVCAIIPAEVAHKVCFFFSESHVLRQHKFSKICAHGILILDA